MFRDFGVLIMIMTIIIAYFSFFCFLVCFAVQRELFAILPIIESKISKKYKFGTKNPSINSNSFAI